MWHACDTQMACIWNPNGVHVHNGVHVISMWCICVIPKWHAYDTTLWTASSNSSILYWLHVTTETTLFFLFRQQARLIVNRNYYYRHLKTNYTLTQFQHDTCNPTTSILCYLFCHSTILHSSTTYPSDVLAYQQSQWLCSSIACMHIKMK